MHLIEGTTEFVLDGPCAVAIGKFDGIHRGHQKLLEKIAARRKQGMYTAVFTFDPSPMVFFGSGESKGLTTREEKRRIFSKLGIDFLIEFPLTEETAAIPAQQFIEEILVKRMKAAYIAAGRDVTFGNRGEGNSEMLLSYGKKLGFEVELIEKIHEAGIDNAEISSSLIREEIEKGDMERVKQLIGFPYSITGTVEHGRKLGRRLGMPTVNLLPPPDKLLPPNGVYYSYVSYNGKHYKSITNIGCKPTVSEDKVMSVETYLYDFHEEIYGKTITVNLLKFKRPEIKFDTIEQLKEQMQRDIAEGNGGYEG